MATADLTLTGLRTPETPDADLLAICQQVFASFSRSDQRRWGETYVAGLATVPGRKSIRRIAEAVTGWRADQCLQQFVNQSPWEWEPVRASLAHTLDRIRPVRAWAIDEVVFPKNGSASVGVARQYSCTAGAVLNCQLALAVSLCTAEASFPVNWRLMLPDSWLNDPELRNRSHLPEDEPHRTRWGHVLDAVDEMILDWQLPAAPIVMDTRNVAGVEPLLAGLEARGLRYMIRVLPSTPVAVLRSGNLPTVGEIAAASLRGNGRTLTAAGRDLPSRRRFLAVSLSSVTGQPGQNGQPGQTGQHESRPALAARRVVAEWSPRRQGASATWLTNIVGATPADLAELIRLAGANAADLAEMGDASGLRHFEGRSFRGWQHHVTLASVAHAHQKLCRPSPAPQITSPASSLTPPMTFRPVRPGPTEQAS